MRRDGLLCPEIVFSRAGFTRCTSFLPFSLWSKKDLQRVRNFVIVVPLEPRKTAGESCIYKIRKSFHPIACQTTFITLSRDCILHASLSVHVHVCVYVWMNVYSSCVLRALISDQWLVLPFSLYPGQRKTRSRGRGGGVRSKSTTTFGPYTPCR